MKKIYRILPTLLYAALIFYLSSRPWDGLTFLPPHIDKVIHFGMYLIFGVLVIFSIRLKRWVNPLPQLLISFMIIAAYGASDEFHQSFVKGREASFYDWIADLIGGISGVILGYTISKLFRRKNVV